jgi:hypothetical protein
VWAKYEKRLTLMTDLLLIWLVLALFCIALVRRGATDGALLLAYFFGLSLIHVPGAVNYLGSGRGLHSMQETLVGFRATLIGLAALLTGYVAHRCIVREQATSSRLVSNRASDSFNAWHMFLLGIIAYVFATPLAVILPSLTSLVSPIGSLLIVGIIVLLRDSIYNNNRINFLTAISVTGLLPIFTIVASGFLGFGIYWALAVVCYLFNFSRRRWAYVAAAPLVVWLGLSLSIAYFEQREEIRKIVWVQQASIEERLDQVAKIFDRFEIYDVENPSHTYWIDQRLNQNHLVGTGIMRHQRGRVDLLNGSSIPFWIVIPRIIWQDKPNIGGGGEIVSKFTGIRFARGTSVGAGQVFEFYANFGWFGLVAGFLALGAALAYFDRRIARALSGGDLRSILSSTLPGLALLQPGGNLSEILVGFLAAIVTARLIPVSLLSQQRLQPRAAP